MSYPAGKLCWHAAAHPPRQRNRHSQPAPNADQPAHADLRPLYQSVTLTSTSRNETSVAPAPVYTLKAQIPALQGSSDARVTNFNNEMTLLTQEEVAKFKDNAAEVRGPGRFIRQQL